MTTPQPAALPELPEPFALSLSIHDGENCKWPLLECTLFQKHPAEKQHLYTADQMRARDAMWAERLAAQQPKPAEVSDAEIVQAAFCSGAELHCRTLIVNGKDAHDFILHFARALLALRPAQQADHCVGCRQPASAETVMGCKTPSRCGTALSPAQQATPEPVGEVVAWLSTDCIGERYLCFTKPQDSDTVRPLVFGDTHPAPAPQQVPMTDEQADALADAAFQDYMLDRNDDMNLALVRAVETHHGITAKGAQGVAVSVSTSMSARRALMASLWRTPMAPGIP